MKRLIDAMLALIGLVLGAPFLAVGTLAVWAQDRHAPFYVAPRMAKGEGTFRMVKLRTMRVGAASTGVSSTAGDDGRITSAGKTIRRLKLDELPQLWNVLKGEMSLVGPRPQVPEDATRYTTVERDLLSVRPGITDLASIVFADEGEILRGSLDPDATYDAQIRPWKNRLALLYVYEAPGTLTDLRVILLTVLNVFNRPAALRGVAHLVDRLGGTEALRAAALREGPLREAAPPGTPGTPLHFRRSTT